MQWLIHIIEYWCLFSILVLSSSINHLQRIMYQGHIEQLLIAKILMRLLTMDLVMVIAVILDTLAMKGNLPQPIMLYLASGLGSVANHRLLLAHLIFQMP